MSFYDVIRSWILPLKQIDGLIPENTKVLDLGCGEGVLAAFLARQPSRQVLGVDADRTRLPKSTLKNLNFKYADITKFDFIGYEVVILSDVLHHIPKKDHINLLVKISESLNKNNLLIIKEIDTKQFFRSKFSRVWDFLLYPKDEITFYNSDNLIKTLKKLNFNVKMQYASKSFPGSTTLFICHKK